MTPHDDREQNRVKPLSRIEPISRPRWIFTTDSGGAASGSSSGARNSLTRSRANPQAARRSPRAGAGPPWGTGPGAAAARGASRLARTRGAGCPAGLIRRLEPRYARCTFASWPAWLISIFAAPKRRAKNGRTMLMPWMRSSRALRLAAEQEPAAHLDDLLGDAEGVHAPGQVEHDQDDDQHDRDGEQRPAHRPVPEDLIDRVAALRRRPHEEVDQPIAQVGEDEPEHGEHEDPPAKQRGRRVEPVPLSVGEACDRLRHALPHGARVVGVAHRPARRLSASCTSRSRSASASVSVRPGMATPVEAAAVTNRRSASPSHRASGPRVMSMSCIRP